MNHPAHDSSRLKTLNRIRRLSRLMDTAFKIPGLKLKVGLDPIIGLIPGGGDLVTAVISVYIIFLATRFRLPKRVLGQMVLNIVLEAIVGTVPLLGDVFDVFYKSNIRNLDLLEAHLQTQAQPLPRTDAL
ncbi:MAG: DUF4112 domain-containing protein [Leptolyngbya sp. SIO1E4]|nr:DUF4112 domain-containing protein [Leptolyngbya sp. SIO1E4]